jgi:hypothetical protein
MNKLTLDIAEGRRAFYPGEDIEVVADWSLNQDASAVEFRLIWYTRGKGETDFAIIEARRFEHPSLVETRRFPLTLPDSPYSASGKLVSVIWALELIAQPAGDSTRLDIVIAPHAQEILLHGTVES